MRICVEIPCNFHILQQEVLHSQHDVMLDEKVLKNMQLFLQNRIHTALYSHRSLQMEGVTLSQLILTYDQLLIQFLNSLKEVYYMLQF